MLYRKNNQTKQESFGLKGVNPIIGNLPTLIRDIKDNFIWTCDRARFNVPALSVGVFFRRPRVQISSRPFHFDYYLTYSGSTIADQGFEPCVTYSQCFYRAPPFTKIRVICIILRMS